MVDMAIGMLTVTACSCTARTGTSLTRSWWLPMSQNCPINA